MHTESLYIYLFKAAYLEVNCAHASQGLSSQPYKNQVTFFHFLNIPTNARFNVYKMFLKVSFATTKIDLIQRILVERHNKL